ncbi:MAG: glycosyltransferase [Desulfovibrio sp.]
MHIYFLNYHKFEGSSGIHIHFLANELVQLGIGCTVCVPHTPDSIGRCGIAHYDCITFSDLIKRAKQDPASFHREGVVFHAWTPREIVRRLTEKISHLLNVPYFIHLEDNEELLFETHIGKSLHDAANMSWLRRRLLPKSFIHPEHYSRFMTQAAGVTCIMESLTEFVPEGLPSLTFWPACEDLFFDLPIQPNLEIRHRLGLSPEAVVLTYTGNVHNANVGEVSSLYEAVGRLNATGREVRLIRCGSDHASLSADAVAAERYVSEIGNIPSSELYKYISAANILVQPGKDDVFNRYRFPSKLPMFLASGRPVVLPSSNIGLRMSHSENCLLLKSGDVSEIVTAVELLIDDAGLARTIGDAGRSFAKTHFSWQTSAQKVLGFYNKILRERL